MAIPPALAWSYLLCGYDAIRERNPKLTKTLSEGIFEKKKKKKKKKRKSLRRRKYKALTT
jgi:hypothetical protein